MAKVGAGAGGFDNPAVFDRLARTLRRRYGLSLGPHKASLAASRLGALATADGVGLERYVMQRLESADDDYDDIVDRLTTSYTSFFRYPEQFRFLEQRLLPAYTDERSVTIWSAGCATGEEAYSIALTAAEVWPDRALPRVAVIASDVSRPALERARAAVYRAHVLSELDEERKRRFFLRGHGAKRGLYRVKPELRAQIDFRRINLAERWPALPEFDLIVCANVMIYFSPEARLSIGRRLARQLRPGGWLMVGSAENVAGERFGLTAVGPSTYRKVAGT